MVNFKLRAEEAFSKTCGKATVWQMIKLVVIVSSEGIFVYIFGQGMVVCVCPSTVYANIKGTVS